MVWITGTLFMLDNLGFRISAVIAGLGIGGIAVALAAQSILGDLFGDFIILFDRPFEIVYFVDGNDYTRYMDLQQQVNLRLFEEFRKRGIEFAYPTRTLYLAKT